MHKYLLLIFTLTVFIAFGCNESNNGGEEPTIEFDRREMLTGWVDNVFVPAYTELGDKLQGLADANNVFAEEPSEENLTTLRDAFFSAYLSFQKASPFVVGKGEEIRIREQLNTYPTNIDLITTNVSEGNANLELPSQVTAQGFPAIEYILFGLDSEIILAGQTNSYRDYISLLISRMQTLQSEVLNDWTASRDTYIQNDGNSATASIDRTVNDFIFYYEKHLRAGKVGIPAGVFSDDPLDDRVESLYQGASKTLFLSALNNSIDFFENYGLKDYLDASGVERDGEMLSVKILNQWDEALLAAQDVEESFGSQVTNDNVKMLQLYDELQRNVILLKVDMLQALSINVDYVDADGD